MAAPRRLFLWAIMVFSVLQLFSSVEGQSVNRPAKPRRRPPCTMSGLTEMENEEESCDCETKESDSVFASASGDTLLLMRKLKRRNAIDDPTGSGGRKKRQVARRTPRPPGGGDGPVTRRPKPTRTPRPPEEGGGGVTRRPIPTRTPVPGQGDQGQEEGGQEKGQGGRGRGPARNNDGIDFRESWRRYFNMTRSRTRGRRVRPPRRPTCVPCVTKTTRVMKEGPVGKALRFKLENFGVLDESGEIVYGRPELLQTDRVNARCVNEQMFSDETESRPSWTKSLDYEVTRPDQFSVNMTVTFNIIDEAMVEKCRVKVSWTIDNIRCHPDSDMCSQITHYVPEFLFATGERRRTSRPICNIKHCMVPFNGSSSLECYRKFKANGTEMDLNEEDIVFLESDLLRFVFPRGRIEYDPTVTPSTDELTQEDQDRLLYEEDVGEKPPVDDPDHAISIRSNILMLTMVLLYSVISNL